MTDFEGVRGLRVLHVIPGLAVRQGGPSFAVVDSARVVAATGSVCTVFTTDLAEAASSRQRARLSASDLPRRAETLDIRFFRAMPPKRLAYAPTLGSALDAEVENYDVVHVHSLFLYPQFAAWRAARKAKVPIIVAPCGALDPALRRRSRLAKAVTAVLWQRDMLQHASALHFKTDEERRLALDLRLAPRQFVVPNGIDWRSFQDSSDGDRFRDRFLAGSGKPIILNVGRLSHKKGLDLLIRAFAQVRRADLEALLVLAGPDDEGLTPQLQRLVRDLGLQDEAVFPGALGQDDLKDALASAAVWALPSKTENFANAVVEAMAAGVPVVVSPAVNLAREIEAAGAGVVCERTPGALAAAIASLLESASRRAVIGTRAREFARGYDWGRVATRLLAMYSAVAGATRTSFGGPA